MNSLRSGESVSRQWRSVNDLVRNAQFRGAETYNTQQAFASRPPRQLRTPLGGGGFMGEYDSTKAYSTGQTFVVTTSHVVAGITIVPGYYGVPPAGLDSAGSTWSGNVPANPTGNAVPQYPLPAIGSAPNDKFYAQPIVVYCGGY